MRKKYIYNFQQFETIRSFSDDICSGKINQLENSKPSIRKYGRI